MRIIVSPAKKMRTETDLMECKALPVFTDRAAEIAAWIRGMSFEEQKKLWACNDKIAEENRSRFARMDLTDINALTPAILSYDGIQYQYMAPNVFEEGQYFYVEDHVRILSGFYGVLQPMDGVVPYRLEMQAKGAPGNAKNMYEYWGESIYREVKDDSGIIINLASKEYSKCVEKYLQAGDNFITCIFGELNGEKVVQKGVYAKMARGEMVRFLAEIHAQTPEKVKQFDRSGYSFDEKRSDEHTYTFLK